MDAKLINNLFSRLSNYPRVVFDLDGTLYDVRDYERPALNEIAKMLRNKSGLPLDGLEMIFWKNRESDRHNRKLFDSVLFKYKLPKHWIHDCIECWRNSSVEPLRTCPSLVNILLELRAIGIELSLVSNGDPLIQDKKIQALGMGNLFYKKIYCDPRIQECLKPEVWGWSMLEEWRMRYPTVYIGDDPIDEKFAFAGNADFISFTFKNESYEN